jgi:hypothetical protein
MKREIKIRNAICFAMLVALMAVSFGIYSITEKIDSLAQSVESFPDHSQIPDDNLKGGISVVTIFLHVLALAGVIGVIVLFNLAWAKMGSEVDKEINEVIGREPRKEKPG